MSGAPNIPILKYTTHETWKDPTIKSQWYQEDEKKEFSRLEVNNAFGTCGSSSEGQKCTLGYKYTATTLTRHRGLVNGLDNIMVYSVNADSDTNVRFNGIGYSPRWIYVMNPLGVLNIDMDVENDVRMYNYGGSSNPNSPVTGTADKPLSKDSDKNNLYGKVERSFYPFQDALYVKKINEPKGSKDVERILRKKETASNKNITEFIIEHQSKATTDREKLWLVIPMDVNYYEKMDDEDKVIQPSSHFERALQWMYKQWVSNPTDVGNPVEEYYNQPVELGDAIPKLMSSSPYTYIKHEYDGTVHHILHFKYEKVKRINHKFNIGFISGIDSKKANIEDIKNTKFKSHDIPRNVEIYQTNESGAELIKNYNNKVRSKKGVNMVCRPVKIGGDNDEKNFVVAQEKVDEAKTEGIQLDIMKRLQGPGMIFGIAIMMLILMIFIIPVGMYYATTGKSIPVAFFLVLGTLLIAPIVFYIISNGIFK